MTRIAALIAGLVLFLCPGLWLLDFSGVAKYRHPGADAFLFLGATLFAIYGSVLLGVAVYWVRAKQSGLPSFPIEIFKAGMWGVLAACIVYFIGGSIYGLAIYGSFEKVIGGNLWGLLAIFWGVLSALVSAGIALLFYAWRGRAGSAGAATGTGPWSSPPGNVSV
jgi:hypothetical protein